MLVCLMKNKTVKISILYILFLLLSSPIYGQVSEQQKEFIDVISKAILDYKDARNELQEWTVRDQRKESVQSILSGQYRINDWYGTVKMLNTDSSGNARLRIEIAPKIIIKTFGDDTMIRKGTELYKRLINMSRGLRVKFSGQFFPDENDYIEEVNYGRRYEGASLCISLF